MYLCIFEAMPSFSFGASSPAYDEFGLHRKVPDVAYPCRFSALLSFQLQMRQA